jgi:hypothetical protein
MQKEQLIATDAEPTEEQMEKGFRQMARDAIDSGEPFVMLAVTPGEKGNQVRAFACCEERHVFDAAIALTSSVGAIAIGEVGMNTLPPDAAHTLALVAGLRSLQSYATEAAKGASSLQPGTDTAH